MRILLLSTYDLGRQPVALGTAAAALRGAGHQVTARDLAVEPWDAGLLAGADAVAISVPMHTALRLAAGVVERVRRARPGIPIVAFGLYAAAAHIGVDHHIAGEFEPELVRWADGVARGAAPTGVRVDRGRHPVPAPDRSVLPAFGRYARLVDRDGEQMVAAVEASRGCSHRCRHCPVPVVYDGRVRLIDEEVVLGDVAAAVAAGAGHITFADPDFLNAPRHALRVVEAMRAAFPDLTYDLTTKVEHVLRHADLWSRLAPGLRFVVSAFETTDDAILRILDKGHTAADMADAVHLLRRHGVEVRPSWLPFTPWTTLTGVGDVLRFIARHDLIDNVDPVQLSIRLLIPPGSLLLGRLELTPHVGDYDPAMASWTWSAADPRVDDLQQELADLAAAAADSAEEPATTFARMWDVVAGAGGGLERAALPAGATTGRPRMTEPWFC